MSERELPEDPSAWPADPYELLGVGRSASTQEIKRAYTKLLRRYNPERFPEQFQRIRRAYEMLLRLAELTAIMPLPEEASPRVKLESSHAPYTSASVEECWQQARRGQEAEAYRELEQLVMRQPGNPATYARLYWLLWTRPDLDSSRRPSDWLYLGLEAEPRVGKLTELLLEEVADRPEEALSESFWRLLARSRPRGMLETLLECRWAAADRLNRWDIPGQDLDAFRDVVQNESEENWVRLLVDLVARLAWLGSEEGGGLFDRSFDEVYERRHLGLSLSHEFDRLEYLAATRAQCRRLLSETELEDEFIRVMRSCVNRTAEEIRTEFEGLLEKMSREPVAWLNTLDLVRDYAPAVLAHFGSLLGHFAQSAPEVPSDSYDHQKLIALAVRFLNSVNEEAEYQDYRRRLLEFLIKKMIQPQRLAEITFNYPCGWLTGTGSLGEAILADWPLRYVYQANALLWT
jgi:hypothetical protein